MRVLIINPNTSEQMTDGFLATAQAITGGTIAFEARTASRGVAVVASRASYALAAVGVLKVWAEYRGDCDAILVACFGDPGVPALRELADVPVFGLAETAMRAAGRRHRRVAVVTAGPAWVPMIDELAASCRITSHLGTFAVEATGLSARADPVAFQAQMQGAVTRAEEAGADAILLGGAALAGSASRYRAAVPVLDCVALSLDGLRAQVTEAHAPSPAAPSIASSGLDPALSVLLVRPRPKQR